MVEKFELLLIAVSDVKIVNRKKITERYHIAFCGRCGNPLIPYRYKDNNCPYCHARYDRFPRLRYTVRNKLVDKAYNLI